jgi:hypothetical protein
MLRKLFMALVAIQASTFVFGQDVAVVTAPTASSATTDNTGTDKKPFLTITGSADAYYRYDFAKTKANNFTAFTNSHNAFQLGMASVKLEHHSDKVGFVADLGFGQRAKDFSYTDDGITQAIKQLYISYNATSWLKFTAGTWATHVGYELVDPQLNRNYSMSYMFTNGPFSHTGVKADISKGKHGVMVGISNATDYRTPPDGQINKKFLIAQYSYAVNDNWKLYLNYVGGKAPDTSKTSQVDAVVTGKLSDKFSIGYNGTVNAIKGWDGTKNVDSKSWWGSALYLNVDPKSWLGLTLRGEYFSDKDQLKTFAVFPEGGNIFATTVSANFKVDGFILIPEFRFENASKDIYVDKTGAPTGKAGSFLIAAVYSF